MKNLKLILSSLCLVISSVAMANMQVSNLKDYNFGEIDLKNTNEVNHSLCVYSSDTTNTAYKVEVHSAGPGGHFEMSNGISSLPYTVNWSPVAAGGVGYVTLSPNVAVRMDNASGEEACPKGDNANLQISVNANALAGVTAGNYSTSLFITISPV